jgi:alpha-1,2-mannosyltransferase
VVISALERREPSRRSTALLIGAAALSALVLGAYLGIWGRRYGLDLNVYRDAASAWRSGSDPYGLTFTRHQLDFTYPPFALAFLAPLSMLSLSVSQVLLWVLSVAGATVVVGLVLREGGMTLTARTWSVAVVWSCASVIIFEPARSGLDYGQIELILMFLVAVDLLAMPERLRGVGIGLAAAVKLTPIVFVLVLVVSRDLKAAARALGTFGALTLMMWLGWPGLSSTFWTKDLANTSRVGQLAFLGNQSLLGVLHRASLTSPADRALWLAASVIALAAGVVIAWRCIAERQRPLAMLAIALCGLLVSPISWSHHWVWVVLIPPMLLTTARGAIPALTRWMLWGVAALCVLGPYWWLSTGWAAEALGDVLPLWTLALLVSWASIELKRLRDRTRAHRGGEPLGATGPTRPGRARPLGRFEQDDTEHMGLVPLQDVRNIEEQQRGLHSRGFVEEILATE